MPGNHSTLMKTHVMSCHVMCIIQVVTFLGNGKPQVLEICKNILPMILYWVLFPIEDLGLAVETFKRILTKEKIDRQLAGQSPSTPFMNIRDGYISSKKVVKFDMKDWLDDKLDKITSMMSKLTAQGSSQNRAFKSKNVSRKRKRTNEALLWSR